MATTFILGAGFSKCSGLPIQSEFSSLLLADEFSSGLDLAITRIIKRFVKDVFGWREGHPLPALEDIFTCVDLSAGTGHHLGIKYTPKLLRAIRRMAIYRIFSVLDRRSHISKDITSLLQHATRRGHVAPPAFVVLNWDIVLEKHLQELSRPISIDYACDAADWNGLDRKSGKGRKPLKVPICKMHGSSNWVYCENCSALYFDVSTKLSLRSKVGLIKSDFRLFDQSLADRKFDQMLGILPVDRQCRRCKNMVSSHIATFSYRKSFRTHAYSAIWHRAGEILADSDHWVFIGYSLPKADFELKHLLKSAQLRFAHLPNEAAKQIDVVVLGDAARQEYENYFGPGKFQYFSGGLKEYVDHLKAPGRVPKRKLNRVR